MSETYTTLHPPVAKSLRFNDATSGNTTTLMEGMFVIHDDTQSSAANQTKYVTRPSYSNIRRGAFLVGPKSAGATNGSSVQCVPIQEAAGYTVKALVDQACSAGDILGPHIGTHYARPGALFTRWGLRALEAGTGTAAAPDEVLCEIVPFIDDFEYGRKHIAFFDDFDNYNSNGLINTSTGTSVVGLKDSAGSVLRVTTGGTDDNSEEIQLDGERWKFTAAKPLWFEAKWALPDVTQCDAAIGLATTDTTVIDGGQDNALFLKDDGDASLDYDFDKDGTATAGTAIATLVNDTFVTTGIYWDGIDTVTIYRDGSAESTTVTTNLNDDELMAVSFAIQAGEAAAKSIDVDYINVAQHA